MCNNWIFEKKQHQHNMFYRAQQVRLGKMVFRYLFIWNYYSKIYFTLIISYYYCYYYLFWHTSFTTLQRQSRLSTRPFFWLKNLSHTHTYTHIQERARTRTHRPPQTKHITAFSLYIIYFISHILTRLFGNVFFIYVLRYFFFASTLGPPAWGEVRFSTSTNDKHAHIMYNTSCTCHVYKARCRPYTRSYIIHNITHTDVSRACIRAAGKTI